MLRSVSDNRIRNERKVITGQSVRNYEDSGMWAVIIEKLNSQSNKVVSIASNEASSFRSRQREMFTIMRLPHAALMSANGVNLVVSEYGSNLWAQVFVEIISQRRLEGRNGYILSMSSLVISSFCLIIRSMSSG